MKSIRLYVDNDDGQIGLWKIRKPIYRIRVAKESYFYIELTDEEILLLKLKFDRVITVEDNEDFGFYISINYCSLFTNNSSIYFNDIIEYLSL